MTDRNALHYPIAIALTVRDIVKTAAYFRDLLGFEMKESWPDPQNPMWANMILDRQSVMLNGLMPEAMLDAGGFDEGAKQYMRTLNAEFAKHQPGVGAMFYIAVPDVDAYHAKLKAKGVEHMSAPQTQFYGLREFALQTPDMYRFMFYTQVTLATCQSCSMPLTDAKPAQMYCAYCVDEKGKLKPYEVIFEGCINGYFIPMQKMSRPQAEVAAREMLAKMPAWAGRK